MEQNEILQEVTRLMKKVFENESLAITMDTTNRDVAEWDSLNYTAIITAIEKHYGIKFKMREFLDFKNVGDIVKTIHSKLS